MSSSKKGIITHGKNSQLMRTLSKKLFYNFGNLKSASQRKLEECLVHGLKGKDMMHKYNFLLNN